MKFYKSGSQWVLDALTLDSGQCYKVESANGNRMEIKLLSDHRSLTNGCPLYTDYTAADGTPYTKEQVNDLLKQFFRPDTGVAGGCVPVTPHATALLPHVGWITVFGNAGNVAVVDEYGNDSVVVPLDQNGVTKFRCSRVLVEGTTATSIHLIYK
jgi:hypothetical protein